MSIELIHGDCLDFDLPQIDLVLADPPYGTTACKWDSVIPFEPMWEQIWRVSKQNAAVCLFGSEPFASKLRLSSKYYKYDWVWKKNQASNFATAKYQPLREHETISVFYKEKATYNPQKEERAESSRKRLKSHITPHSNPREIYSGLSDDGTKRFYNKDYKNPGTVQFFKVVPRHSGTLHPTQKPVELLEYLIKTYTNEGDTVLDFCMGSGSTGVACQNTGRNFIGIEKEKKYYDIACERMAFKG